MKYTPLYIELAEYTQAEETALAVSMTGNTRNYQPTIYNTTLVTARRWNGTAFENMPQMPASHLALVNSDLPIMSATVGGAVPAPPNNTTTFLRGDGTFSTPAGSGDMVLASAQTNSGVKTFLATTLLLRNVANTFSSLFTNTATAARTWTMKDADGTVAFTSDITGTNSGTNSGDQTSIVGISGTKAQFNTAVSDGDIQYIGDAPTAHTHLLAAGATDVTVTAANLNILDDGLNTTLHFHDADRARANHTGTQSADTLTDGTTNKAFLATERTKLTGVATGATVNSADATLLARANHTGTQTAATISDLNANVPNAHYRVILDTAGSHIAARVAGTYAIGMGDPLAVSGTGTLYPLNTIYIAAADYPTVNGVAAKLRIRVQLYTNDVAPTGNYTIGLYPITRPATSGGAGLCVFTLGTVVSGSNGATFTAPAADGLLQAVGADFALPADGHYVLGVVTTATVATSALVQVNAKLQMRNA